VAARKLRIKDVIIGRLESDGGSRNTLTTNFGESHEVRVCGTVVNKFISDDENYGNLVLDDGSESIQLKFWRADVDQVRQYEVGDFSDVIATVREYNEERYLQPVQLFKGDVHRWIRFHLDVALRIKQLSSSSNWETESFESPQEDGFDKEIYSDSGPSYEQSVDDTFEEDSIIFDDDDINRAVLEAMENEPLSKDEIIGKTSLDEIDVMLSIKELLESGSIFEVDGKYKKL